MKKNLKLAALLLASALLFGACGSEAEVTDSEPQKSSESAEEVNESKQSADKVKESKETKEKAAPEGSGESLSFTSATLKGDEVSDDIFSDHDITVVHVWGTYCGPCIEEMGDYASFYEDMPEGVNLVGIVCDVYEGSGENVDAAEEILSDAGASFENITVNDSLMPYISDLQFIPSSFFVDRNGKIIGEKLEGADYSQTMDQLEQYL